MPYILELRSNRLRRLIELNTKRVRLQRKIMDSKATVYEIQTFEDLTAQAHELHRRPFIQISFGDYETARQRAIEIEEDPTRIFFREHAIPTRAPSNRSRVKDELSALMRDIEKAGNQIGLA